MPNSVNFTVLKALKGVNTFKTPLSHAVIGIKTIASLKG